MENKQKADLFLMGVILTFLLLTFIAFLLNEGKQYFVTPLLMKFFPHKYDVDDDGSDGNYDSGIVYNRRSRYASTKESAQGFGESREMNTIAEGYSSGEDLNEQNNDVMATKM